MQRAPFKIITCLFLLFFQNALLPGQPSRTGARQPRAQKSQSPGEELASFSGVLRMMDRKTLLLKLADDNTIKFERSGKTRFFRDSTSIKDSSVHVGDLVTVEARSTLDGALEAVNVRIEENTGTKPAPSNANPK